MNLKQGMREPLCRAGILGHSSRCSQMCESDRLCYLLSDFEIWMKAAMVEH